MNKPLVSIDGLYKKQLEEYYCIYRCKVFLTCPLLPYECDYEIPKFEGKPSRIATQTNFGKCHEKSCAAWIDDKCIFWDKHGRSKKDLCDTCKLKVNAFCKGCIHEEKLFDVVLKDEILYNNILEGKEYNFQSRIPHPCDKCRRFLIKISKSSNRAYDDKNDRYESKYEEEQPNGWISPNDKLPDTDESVLIYSEHGGIAEGYYSHKRSRWLQYRWSVDQNVLYWMPFPKPPISQNKESSETE